MIIQGRLMLMPYPLLEPHAFAAPVEAALAAKIAKTNSLFIGRSPNL